MGKLEGKVALVTGGSSGIGLATAKQFVNEDAYVFITGRHQPELDAAVKDIGRNITAVSGDVSKLSKAIIRGEAPPLPVAKLIGFDVISVEKVNLQFERGE